MPRHARQKSESGIYHIMLRGINRQVLFEDEEDKEKFLETIRHYKQKKDLKILGYCLMDNHVHILIKEDNEPIANTMKRIGVWSAPNFWSSLNVSRERESVGEFFVCLIADPAFDDSGLGCPHF